MIQIDIALLLLTISRDLLFGLLNHTQLIDNTISEIILDFSKYLQKLLILFFFFYITE